MGCYHAEYRGSSNENALKEVTGDQIILSSLAAPKGQPHDYYSESCIKQLSPVERKRRLNQRRQAAARVRARRDKDQLKE